jgi:hypothetical protein
MMNVYKLTTGRNEKRKLQKRSNFPRTKSSTRATARKELWVCVDRQGLRKTTHHTKRRRSGQHLGDLLGVGEDPIGDQTPGRWGI